MLKDTNLKKESYPFDWIFSNLTTVQTIIKSDFSDFLNKDFMISSGPNRAHHTIYRQNMFNHHNPKDNDDHYNYFTRCVERFRKLLQTNKNKLFVISFQNMPNSIEAIEKSKNDVLQISEYISTQTTNYYIFAIYHIPSQTTFKIDISDIGNIKFLTLYTKSMSSGRILRDSGENKLLHNCLLNSYLFRTEKI